MTHEAAREIIRKYHNPPAGKFGDEWLLECILAAFPQIAPSKDVVEGAREILPCICTHAFRDNGLHVHGCPWGAYGKNVVAFAEAHAAKEREACAAWHDTEADRHRKISASCRAQGVIGTALVYAKKWQFHEECAAAIRARGAK